VVALKKYKLIKTSLNRRITPLPPQKKKMFYLLGGGLEVAIGAGKSENPDF
jgi:hypothetical protein